MARKRKRNAKLVSSTTYIKRKFPTYDQHVKVKENTVEDRIERKERVKKRTHDEKWEQILKEMKDA